MGLLRIPGDIVLAAPEGAYKRFAQQNLGTAEFISAVQVKGKGLP